MIPLFVKQLLFPDICTSCHKFTSTKNYPLCSECFDSVAIFQTLVCAKCRARLSENKKICHQDSYALGVATSYHKPATQKTIQAIKFKHLDNATPFLASLLINFTEKLQPPPHILQKSPLVSNIPLSKERLRERGFDQSALIAQHFAKHFDLPYKQVLLKIKNTPPQSSLEKKEERQQNVRDVFIAIDAPTKKRTPLILIDDIATTGATLDEAAKTLRQKNYAPILALTVAGS